MTQFERNRTYVQRLKEAPCADCGGEFPPQVMDFDHVTQAKTANISRLLYGPTARLRIELKRCELVCANCHRARTAYRRYERHLAASDDADVRALVESSEEDPELYP